MRYTQFFQDAIGKLKSEQRYRVFADIERDAERFPHAIWREPEARRMTSPSGARTIISAWASIPR